MVEMLEQPEQELMLSIASALYYVLVLLGLIICCGNPTEHAFQARPKKL